MQKILAIIPARGGSKRLPGKNLMPLNGQPLISRTVRFAAATGLFDHIVVSSDDDGIIATAVAAGAEQNGLRPPHLSSDTAGSAEVLQYELAQAEARWGRFDLVALLQPTTPYRRAERWTRARDMMAADPQVPSVIGVSPLEVSPFQSFLLDGEGQLSPLFPDMVTARSQDLPMTVRANGSLYLVRADMLRATGKIYYDNSRAVLCDRPEEGLDIDTAADFEQAEITIRRLEGDAQTGETCPR